MGEKGTDMPLTQLMTTLRKPSGEPGKLRTIQGNGGQGIDVYPASVRMHENELFFIGREKSGKNLYRVTIDGKNGRWNGLEGEPVPPGTFGKSLRAHRHCMDHDNAGMLREVFPFTRPVLLGLADSFGFGDRLGIANPAHLRALAGSHMRPVLAQQSIRELDRTQRTAEDVLDAASWAAFQEGFTDGFGADADHLKTTDDIDRYARAGFTMYTFDPSAHVVNEAVTLLLDEVRRRAKQLDSQHLRLDDVLARYVNQTFRLDGGMVLQPRQDEITRAFVKYGGVILHTLLMYRHLKDRHAALPTEVELSVDETDIPTTPIEHLFIAGELKRLGVKLVSLAPRFIGDFEKGVDYRGDLQAFAREYVLHAAIAKMQGPYKISIHSGSDKFSIYRTIGSLHLGNVHVKTAGTSYLEALRTVAKVEPGLIREILSFACENYAEDRKSYHVTGQVDRVPDARKCSNQDLLDLFDQHDARQVFHVTFGKVLTTRDAQGNYLFRDRLMACLDKNENVHYATLIAHFRKHLDPFAHHNGKG